MAPGEGAEPQASPKRSEGEPPCGVDADCGRSLKKATLRTGMILKQPAGGAWHITPTISESHVAPAWRLSLRSIRIEVVPRQRIAQGSVFRHLRQDCLYESVDTKETLHAPIGRVFQSGHSQAVRLPEELCLDVDRVEITREADALIVRPHIVRSEAWASLKIARNCGVSDDFLYDGRNQPAGQDRSELDDLFR